MSENREPSMEEIVASIRRIIAQGGGPAGSAAPAAPGEQASSAEPAAEAPATPEDAILPDEAAAPDAESIAEPFAFSETPLAEPAPPVPPEPPVELSAETESTMIDASDETAETQPFPAAPAETESYASSAETSASSDEESDAYDAVSADTSGSDILSAARVEADQSDEPALVTGPTAESTRAAFGQLTDTFSGKRDSRTVEEIVEGLLRPQLKAWLDENLASIVHARVQAEVERIARTHGR